VCRHRDGSQPQGRREKPGLLARRARAQAHVALAYDRRLGGAGVLGAYAYIEHATIGITLNRYGQITPDWSEAAGIADG